jgi:hypothetical protein
MSNKNIFLVTLLSCSALVYPSLVQAETVSAKTSWAIGRVASMSQGSYCTMAQKYSDDTVLTLARNTSEENSLAIDFKDNKFKSLDKQDVTLSPQGGSPQKFSVKPKSERTIVINLGKDGQMIDKIANAENLSVDMGGKVIQFAMNEFKAGQAELQACMSGLKSASANINKLTEENLVRRQVAVIRTPEIETSQPTAEGLLAAMPMPSADITPAVSPQKEAEFIQVKEAVKPAEIQPPKDNQDILSLKEENAQLTRAISEQRQSFENQKSSKEMGALNELREKLNMAQSENESLKSELDKQKTIAGKTENLANQSQRSSQELEALKAENETLKNQLKIASTSKPAPASVAVADDEVIKVRNELRQVSGQLDVLKAENLALKDQIVTLQKGTESNQLKAAGGNWDIEQSTRRYQESQREIVRLGALLQAKDAKCTQEKKDIEYMLFDPAIADKAQIAMLNSLEDKVKEKEDKLKLAENKVAEAQGNVSSEKDAEINQLKQSIVQTKLEYAEKLKQANQSQDEVIASLKSEMDKKNQQLTMAQAEVEKSKLSESTMSTKQQSIDLLKAELAEKSQQLAEAQKKNQDAVNTNASLADKDVEINQLKKSIVQTKLEYDEKLKQANQSQDEVIASLKIEMDQKNQQMTKAQTEIEKSKLTELTLITKQQSLDSLKAELAQKNQQLAEAQKKYQDAENINASLADKDKELVTLKAELAQKNQGLIDAQAKIKDSENINASLADKDKELVTLKAELAQKNQALIDAQTKIQQASAKVVENKDAEQSAAVGNLQFQIQQANQQILILQKQIAEQKNTMVQAAAVVPQVPAVVPQVPAVVPQVEPVYQQPVQSVNFKSVGEMELLLKNAGIDVLGPLQNVQGGNPNTYRAYSWKTGSLFGSVEMKKVSDVSQFNTAVDQYLDRAKTRCKGEFAAIPSEDIPSMGKLKAYEIACVGDSTSSSASVVFNYSDNIVTTIAHEGRAEAMDLVIDARDKVAGQF